MLGSNAKSDEAHYFSGYLACSVTVTLDFSACSFPTFIFEAAGVRPEVIDGIVQTVDQAWGDICDGAEKRRTVLEVASLLGIEPSQCIAMGDGANDLPMMGAVGLSVAYHAKPAVRAQAKVAINTGGLDRLLEVVQPGM